jgi:hypothetical protein
MLSCVCDWLPIEGSLTSVVLVKCEQKSFGQVLFVPFHRHIAPNLSVDVLVTVVTNGGTGDT